jgi:hypothetical protein
LRPEGGGADGMSSASSLKGSRGAREAASIIRRSSSQSGRRRVSCNVAPCHRGRCLTERQARQSHKRPQVVTCVTLRAPSASGDHCQVASDATELVSSRPLARPRHAAHPAHPARQPPTFHMFQRLPASPRSWTVQFRAGRLRAHWPRGIQMPHAHLTLQRQLCS